MQLVSLVENLVNAILADSRPGQAKLSVSSGAGLRAAGGALQLGSESQWVHWSLDFLLSLPEFEGLREYCAGCLERSALQFSHPHHVHAQAVLLSALTEATVGEAQRGVTLYRTVLQDYLEGVLQAAAHREVRFTLCRRLLGVEMAATHLELSGEVSLVRLSDEELTERLPPLDLWQYGLISADSAPLHRVEIRVERAEKLTHFDSLFQGPSRPRLYLRETERVQEALLLLKPESQVELGTPFFLVSQPALGKCSAARLPRSVGSAVFPPSLIRAEDTEDLRRSFQVAIRAQSFPALRSALHRYALAGSRQRSEDRLVDLVIGFESLLLQGLQNELSHRFSLNGSSLSHWIHRAPRQQSYHLFRSAYAARSALVHGYGPKLKSAHLESLCDELRHLLASFIEWLIEKSPGYGLSPRMQSEDWLRILFESPA